MEFNDNQDNTANTEVQQKQLPLLTRGSIINSQFEVVKRLGYGSFGEVYLGNDLKTGNQVAIKAEIISDQQSQLAHEAKIMKLFSHIEGFPEIYYSGQDEDGKLVLVMELLGQNLQQQLIKSRGKMSLKTVLMLIDQMLKRIETLHNKSFLYRDIKPENWMLGKNKGMNTVYLIDFGLVKQYKNKVNKHITFRDNKGLIGTARFVSINTHLGLEQSRRDDLESMGYIWIYLLKGKLPWQGLRADTKEEKYEKLKLKKLQVSVDQLCSKIPQEFVKYMDYCRSLKFEEQPDYCELKQMFKELFFRLYINWDFLWDWIILSSEGDQLKSCDCDENDCHICDDQANQMVVYSSVYEVGQQSEDDINLNKSSNILNEHQQQMVGNNNICESANKSQYSQSVSAKQLTPLQIQQIQKETGFESINNSEQHSLEIGNNFQQQQQQSDTVKKLFFDDNNIINNNMNVQEIIGKKSSQQSVKEEQQQENTVINNNSNYNNPQNQDQIQAQNSNNNSNPAPKKLSFLSGFKKLNKIQPNVVNSITNNNSNINTNQNTVLDEQGILKQKIEQQENIDTQNIQQKEEKTEQKIIEAEKQSQQVKQNSINNNSKNIIIINKKKSNSSNNSNNNSPYRNGDSSCKKQQLNLKTNLILQQQLDNNNINSNNHINFKICSPNQKQSKVNLEKYKVNSINLFQTILEGNNSTSPGNNNNINNNNNNNNNNICSSTTGDNINSSSQQLQNNNIENNISHQ